MLIKVTPKRQPSGILSASGGCAYRKGKERDTQGAREQEELVGQTREGVVIHRDYEGTGARLVFFVFAFVYLFYLKKELIGSHWNGAN
jgi:hypothetical protein